MGNYLVTPQRIANAPTRALFGVYWSILIYAIMVCAWGIMVAIFNGPSGSKLIGMGSVVAAFALVVFVLMVALLVFRNKHESNHRFSRIGTHLTSLVVVACIMIVITIPLFTQIPNQCFASHYKTDQRMSRGFYCAWLSVTIGYSWICAIMAGLIAFFIRRRAIRSSHDMKTNIAVMFEARDNQQTSSN